jgi:transglutaminase-like putative cysteine protease
MNFRVHCELEYVLNDPATFLFALKCIETGGQRIVSEELVVDPFIQAEEFTLGTGMNRFSRLRTLNPGNLKVSYRAEVATSVRVIPADSLSPDGPGHLTPEALPFLFPSRYCPSDLIRGKAWELFGHLSGAPAIAAGVRDWIASHIAYVSGSSGETSSALDTYDRRQGVCRDFAHLGIAFCRALNLPARYATVYAARLHPPDFHACFEVFIDGWWLLFDATGLAPLNGLVRIATGRDAADAAVCTIFGNPELSSSVVSCECADPSFQALSGDLLRNRNELVALL